ncbi:hypothetical protein CAE01nite_34040 [Cellulomonas aerilata]|uniref:Uncharacterized protein n=1 Tax=Cellulomonas aerilata TaxID=515326 RepID=A0A512DGQ8_9CELL|nr:hypothetical protein CAE01nite_34040 [Cellulomonas aerilata]
MSGTCLTHTTIFTSASLSGDRPGHPFGARRGLCAPRDEATVARASEFTRTGGPGPVTMHG